MALHRHFHPRLRLSGTIFPILFLLLAATLQVAALSLVPETKYTLQLHDRDVDSNFDFNAGVTHTTTRQLGLVLLAADRISGCHIALCPDSKCYASPMFQIGPRLATDFCQLGPVSPNGSFVSLLAAMSLEYVVMVANISDFKNISVVSMKTIPMPIQGSRGVAILANSTTGVPFFILPVASQFKIYECDTWECQTLSSKTIWSNEALPTASASGWVLRGAMQNSSLSVGISLLMEDSLLGKVFYLHCPDTDFGPSACANFSVTELSVTGGSINPSTNRFGSRQLLWDQRSQLPWVFIPTTTAVVVLRCDNAACSSRTTIRTVPLSNDAIALTQPDWLLLDSVMLLAFPQTIKSSAIIEIIRCTYNSSQFCERTTVWTGAVQYGASLNYKGAATTGTAQLITATSDSQVSGVTIADISDCNSNILVSSPQTAGRCLTCPAGTTRLNSSGCAVCDRAAGFSSPGGTATSCTSCNGPLVPYCEKCPDGWQRMSTSNALCSRCSSYTYSNPATALKCTACPTTWLLLSDFSRCLPDNSSVATVSAKCTDADWARSRSCVGDSTWTGSDSSIGAVCVKSKCVCVEGWRWFNGACYPPLSQHSICTPAPVNSRHGLFRPRMSNLRRFQDGSVEIDFALPLESYSNLSSTGRVLKTEILWTVSGGNLMSQCDFPSGATNIFYSKGTEYPLCEEQISTKFVVSAVRRCPWLGRFSTDGTTVFQFAYFNITRTYLFHDIGTQSTWSETRSAIVNIELDSPNPLKAPVNIDDRLFGADAPNWVLIGILSGLGVVCIIIFIVVVVLFRRVRAAAPTPRPDAAKQQQQQLQAKAGEKKRHAVIAPNEVAAEQEEEAAEDEEAEEGELDEDEQEEEEQQEAGEEASEEDEQGAASETESLTAPSVEESSEDEDAEEDLYACPERCGAYIAQSEMQAHLQVCKARLQRQLASAPPAASSEIIPTERMGAILATANQPESDMVDLNISDTHFRISKAALTKYPNSLLGYLFSDLTTIKPRVDSSGAIIIDRSPEPYHLILPWLQAGLLPTSLDSLAAMSLLTELSFIKLNEMIQAMRAYLLAGLSLQAQNFAGMDLRGYNLSHAELQESDFSGANLSGASLRKCELQNCNFSGADLTDANLSGANLRGASLRGAKMDGCDLTGCELGETDLSGSDRSAESI